jgi:large conductance mechanosensitive channel
MRFAREFVAFLRKFGVIALAVGVLLGEQVNNLEKALIDDVVMPLLSPILPSGEWEKAVIMVGKAQVKIGHLLEAILHFSVVAFTVFVILKLVLKDELQEAANDEKK